MSVESNTNSALSINWPTRGGEPILIEDGELPPLIDNDASSEGNDRHVAISDQGRHPDSNSWQQAVDVSSKPLSDSNPSEENMLNIRNSSTNIHNSNIQINSSQFGRHSEIDQTLSDNINSGPKNMSLSGSIGSDSSDEVPLEQRIEEVIDTPSKGRGPVTSERMTDGVRRDDRSIAKRPPAPRSIAALLELFKPQGYVQYCRHSKCTAVVEDDSTGGLCRKHDAEVRRMQGRPPRSIEVRENQRSLEQFYLAETAAQSVATPKPGQKYRANSGDIYMVLSIAGDKATVANTVTFERSVSLLRELNPSNRVF